MSKDPNSTAVISRRRFIGGAASTAGALALGSPAALAGKTAGGGLSKVQHIVVVMMENRSFDHFLGWLPGADGRQAGLNYYDASGVRHAHILCRPTTRAAGTPTPITPMRADESSSTTAPATAGYARAAMTCTRSATTSARISRSSAAPLLDGPPARATSRRSWRKPTPTASTSMPRRPTASTTAPPRLRCPRSGTGSPPPGAAAVTTTATCRSWPYGAPGTFPSAARWGRSSQTVRLERCPAFPTSTRAFSTRARAPRAMITPTRISATGKHSWTASTEPSTPARTGPAPSWCSTTTSGAASSTTLRPRRRRSRLLIGSPVTGMAGVGFRVPCVVVSPRARRGHIAKDVYDHTSVLRMIEARWSLAPLTVRDQRANNLADVLDFTTTNLHAPRYNVPLRPFGAPCGTPSTGAEDWSGLLTLARSNGCQSNWGRLGSNQRPLACEAIPPGLLMRSLHPV